MVARSRPFHLLIADDDPAMRETLVEMLRPEFDTIDVESGEEAIEVVQRVEVHLALLDVHMPLVTGIDALREVKRRRIELPCILMSANWTERLRLEAIASDVAAVLQKPMTRRELVTTVTTALDAAYQDLWIPSETSSLADETQDDAEVDED
ncbi:MAG: response regulator [Planctomycetaceae bacterium]|nr:response regulator [Planctomycetaceae bacterium]